jgi:hypothetical protein
MQEQLTARQRLAEEIERLSDDEIGEVLEYISIMTSMREEERDPQRFKNELLLLLSQPEERAAMPPIHPGGKDNRDRSVKRAHRFAD